MRDRQRDAEALGDPVLGDAFEGDRGASGERMERTRSP
jgi:hypothetical protein